MKNRFKFLPKFRLCHYDYQNFSVFVCSCCANSSLSFKIFKVFCTNSNISERIFGLLSGAAVVVSKQNDTHIFVFKTASNP